MLHEDAATSSKRRTGSPTAPSRRAALIDELAADHEHTDLDLLTMAREFDLKRVVLAAHAGSATARSRERMSMSMSAVEGLVAGFAADC